MSALLGSLIELSQVTTLRIVQRVDSNTCESVASPMLAKVVSDVVEFYLKRIVFL